MQIDMDKEFLFKDNCLIKAKEIYKQYDLKMDVLDIAKEIYAHAVLFYMAENSKIKTMFHEYILKHCEKIDFNVGGDKKHRQVAYNLIWDLNLKEEG